MRKLALLFAVPLLATCGLTGGSITVEGGTLYGFVVDGLTGQRIDFFAADGKVRNVVDDDASKSSIYIVVNGVFIRAEPCSPNDASEDNEIDTSGCFIFKDLPYDTPIAVFVQAPNYRTFEGAITFTNPNAGLFAPQADSNEPVPPPEYIVTYTNIRLFPIGFSIDYQIFVHLNGTPVPGATVNCQGSVATANAFQISGTYLAAAANNTARVVQGITDADGVALLPGGSLVPGAAYTCEVFRGERFDGSVLSGGTTFTAGVAADRIAVGMTSSTAPRDLYALSSNADDALDLLGLGASLVIKLNRPAEIYPGTADCWTALLNVVDRDSPPDGTGALPANVAGNGASEQVDVQVSADGLTVTVSYKQPATALDTDDRGTSIDFNGIYLRPRGTDDAEAIVRVGAAGACAAAPGSSTLFNLREGATQENTIALF